MRQKIITDNGPQKTYIGKQNKKQWTMEKITFFNGKSNFTFKIENRH